MMSQTKKVVSAVESGKKVRFNRWKNMSIGARISVCVLISVVLISIFAKFITPYSPDRVFTDAILAHPSGSHLFGTDYAGRDVLSRLLMGGRFSIVIGLCSAFIALFFGAIIGSIAAVVRRSLSEVIMRIMDIIMAVPGIAMACLLYTSLSRLYSST